MQEQRKYSRSTSQASVEISHPSFGMLELKAKDLSEGGLFVFMGSHIGPPIGTVLQARIKRYSGYINKDPIDMQVMHYVSGGMGLMFI
jgi:hypothetical protein